MWLAWGDLAEIGEDHSLNQKLLHLSSLLFLMQLPCQAPQPPTGFFVSFDVSLLGHWAHEFSVVV
jgi:hypothetical protein